MKGRGKVSTSMFILADFLSVISAAAGVGVERMDGTGAGDVGGERARGEVSIFERFVKSF
jgi:hypothetical protein